MAAKPVQNITFEPEKVIQPIYTGGDVSVDSRGRILASCLGEEAILTDLVSGETLARLEGDGEVLTTLRITPDGSHLIVCSRSLSMRIYSLRQSSDLAGLEAVLLRTLKPHGSPVVTAAIDSSSTLLATGGSDGTIKVWDIRGGYASHTFRGHSGIISCLHFFDLTPELLSAVGTSQRNKPSQSNLKNDVNGDDSNAAAIALRLASGGEDGKVRIWDLVKRKAIASLDSHVSVVKALDFSPINGILLSGSRDKTLIAWDAKSWKVQKTIPVLESVETAGFIEDGELAYAGGENGCLRIWNTRSGQEITTEQPSKSEGDGVIESLQIKAEHVIITVHVDQTLKFYTTNSLSSSMEMPIDPLPVIRQISGTHDEVIDMAYVGIEKNIMALATNSESVKLISVDFKRGESTKHSFGADVSQLEGHEDIIICLDVDWSGCWLATGAKDNSARLWSLDSLKGSFRCHSVLTGHAESLGAVALPTQQPQNDSAAFKDPLNHPPAFMITGSQDKTIKYWKLSLDSSLKGTRALYTRKAHEKDINAIATNYNSTLFASASQDRTVKIWSTEEGETQGVLRGHKRGVWSVKFAPKNTPSISGDSGAASSGRGLIITGSGDKTVKVWSLSDYSCIRTFEGHTNSILKVLWVPSLQQDAGERVKTQPSPLLASAGSDGLVKIWDASTGECAATLDNHTDRVWSLATNSNTGHLVSGGADGVITFWVDTTASTTAAAAAATIAKVEQEQELLNYIHKGSYRKAITLALQLNHPARLLALFSEVISKHPPEKGSLSGLKAVDEVIASLSEDQLYTLLLRVRDWNTNAKTAYVAQRLILVIMKSYPASHLIGLRKKGSDLAGVIEALTVYTERHFRRCEELIEESYLVDFVVRGMEEGGFVADGGMDGILHSSTTREVDNDMIIIG
jgi:U3 small nucleolar RNA-associated protein 13